MKKNQIILIYLLAMVCALMSCTTYSHKDDISIIAGKLIDSLRLRPNFVLDSIEKPRIVDTVAFEKLYSYHLPALSKYLVADDDDDDDDDDEEDDAIDYLDFPNTRSDSRIRSNRLTAFEKDFHVLYAFNKDLLPPYFGVNPRPKNIPLRDDMNSIGAPKYQIFTINEISIVPELHGNFLKLNLYYGTICWNKEIESYRNMYFFYRGDGISVGRSHADYWLLFQYRQGKGWERTHYGSYDASTNGEWLSGWTNEIPRMCIEAVKYSAKSLSKSDKCDLAFLDWRYIAQYKESENNNENIKIQRIARPDYSLEMEDLELEYFILPSNQSHMNGNENHNDLTQGQNDEYLNRLHTGAISLMPKYRLDGDKFYIDVEVYFAKLDDKQRLTYDLLRTDTYTYQLDSENQWRLIN